MGPPHTPNRYAGVRCEALPWNKNRTGTHRGPSFCRNRTWHTKHTTHHQQVVKPGRPHTSTKKIGVKQVPPPQAGEGTRYAFRNMTDAQGRETQNSETDTSYCGGLVGGLRSHLQPGNKFSSYEHPGTTPAGIQEPPCRVVYFTPIAAQATYSVTPATSVSFTPVVAKQASTLFCFVFPLLTCPGPNRRHVIVFVGYRKKSKIHQRAPCGARTHDLRIKSP